MEESSHEAKCFFVCLFVFVIVVETAFLLHLKYNPEPCLWSEGPTWSGWLFPHLCQQHAFLTVTV